MKKLSLAGVVGSLGCLLIALGDIGCSAAPLAEKLGTTSSKYGAPDPTLCTTSSAQTLADLGIAKWCLYRGKGGVYLTGFSDKGHAVKGLATIYSRNKDGSFHKLALQVNDGSKFSVLHTFGANNLSTSKALATGSQKLVNAATRDLGLMHAALRQKARIGTLTTANKCAANMTGSLLTSFLGAGLSPGAALSMLSQTGAFANASGSNCLGLIGSGTDGVSGLPFNGNIQSIQAQDPCAGDPNPAACRAEFGTFANIGSPGGFSFFPNSSVPGFTGVPASFPGVPGGAFPTSSFEPVPGGSTSFNPNADSINGVPSGVVTSAPLDPIGSDGTNGVPSGTVTSAPLPPIAGTDGSDQFSPQPTQPMPPVQQTGDDGPTALPPVQQTGDDEPSQMPPVQQTGDDQPNIDNGQTSSPVQQTGDDQPPLDDGANPTAGQGGAFTNMTADPNTGAVGGPTGNDTEGSPGDGPPGGGGDGD